MSAFLVASNEGQRGEPLLPRDRPLAHVDEVRDLVLLEESDQLGKRAGLVPDGEQLHLSADATGLLCHALEVGA